MQDLRTEESIKIQTLKSTSHWELIEAKLLNDWEKYNSELREMAANQDVSAPAIAGKLQYLSELFFWFDAKAKDELAVKEEKQIIEDENDY